MQLTFWWIPSGASVFSLRPSSDVRMSKDLSFPESWGKVDFNKSTKSACFRPRGHLSFSTGHFLRTDGRKTDTTTRTELDLNISTTGELQWRVTTSAAVKSVYEPSVWTGHWKWNSQLQLQPHNIRNVDYPSQTRPVRLSSLPVNQMHFNTYGCLRGRQCEGPPGSGPWSGHDSVFHWSEVCQASSS